MDLGTRIWCPPAADFARADDIITNLAKERDGEPYFHIVRYTLFLHVNLLYSFGITGSLQVITVILCGNMADSLRINIPCRLCFKWPAERAWDQDHRTHSRPRPMFDYY